MTKLGIRLPSPVEFAPNNGGSIKIAKISGKKAAESENCRTVPATEFGPIGSGRPSSTIKLPDIAATQVVGYSH